MEEASKFNVTQLKHSVIKAHSSLKIGKRYHKHLRRIFRKVKYKQFSVVPKYLLKLQWKLWMKLLKKTILCFEYKFLVIPKFLIFSPDQPSEKEWMEALRSFQGDVNTIVVKKRVLEALIRNISSAADWRYKLSDEILFTQNNKKTDWSVRCSVERMMITVCNEWKNKENI